VIKKGSESVLTINNLTYIDQLFYSVFLNLVL